MKRKVFILKFKDDTTPLVFTYCEYITLRHAGIVRLCRELGIEENNIDHVEATFITQYEFVHFPEWEG